MLTGRVSFNWEPMWQRYSLGTKRHLAIDTEVHSCRL